MTAEATKLLSELDRLRKANTKLEKSRDELLLAYEEILALDTSGEIDLDEHYYPLNDVMQKAFKLKKEMFEESLPFK